jgi:hypothetical protein
MEAASRRGRGAAGDEIGSGGAGTIGLLERGGRQAVSLRRGSMPAGVVCVLSGGPIALTFMMAQNAAEIC